MRQVIFSFIEENM